MEKSIYKYSLETTDNQVVNLPKGAEILTVQAQFEDLKLWALVDPLNELEERIIEVFGTGRPVHYDVDTKRKYISTYQLNGGNYVFHVFERLS